ncbi:MAG: SDR family NAD(P)-dependent oxidoreductase [Acidimicrobiales bacterium]
MDALVGRTAVVTGGASGMGLAFARRFGQAGMRVVCGDVEAAALDTAVAELRGEGIEATGVVTDVSSGAAMEALLAASLAAYDRVNVVCLNAGVGGGSGRSWTLTEADWAWTLNVNLWGVIHGVRVFVPHLVEHGDGHVVTTASIAGHVSGPYLAPYHVTKHGVVTLSEALYHELKRDGSGVGVTCLCPGFVATNIIDSERNRPAELRNPPREPSAEGGRDRSRAAGDFARQALASGKAPAEVAELVHDAVLSGQFYLFTDDAWDAPIAARHRAIEERAAPSLTRPGSAG